LLIASTSATGEVLKAIDDAQIDILSILQPLDGQASQFPKDWRTASPWLIPRFGRPRPTAGVSTNVRGWCRNF
jgi:hypothetical protein